MSQDRDSMLFRRFRDTKDPALLAGLFDRLSPELLLIARRTCGNVADAQDVVQSTFVAAIQRAHAWQEDEPLLPWLVGILVRQAGLVRRTRRSPDATRLFARRTEEPHHSAVGAELDRALTRALAQLDETYRPVLHLHLRCGMNGREIAQALGRPHARVRQQLVRGLRRLRAMLPPGLLVCVAARIGSGRGLAAVRQEVQAEARATESGMPLGGAPPASLDSMFLGKQLAAAGLLVGLLVLGWWLTRPPEAAALPAMAVADSTALPGPLLVADTDARALPATSPASPSAREEPLPHIPTVPMPENLMQQPLVTFLLSSLAVAQASPWVAVPGADLPPYYAGGLATEPSGQRVVQFGGWNGAAALSPTRLWNGSSWVTATVAVSPPARRDPVLVPDMARGNVLLFGGDNGSGNPFGDTWTWSGTTWTQMFPANTPSARGTGGAWHPSTGRVVLFGGGTSPIPPYLGETWLWDGSNWTQAAPATSPGQRGGGGMATDPQRDRVVMFGGLNSSNQELDETWEWNGANWALVHPGGPGAPSPRTSPALAFDPSRGVTVLFGGIRGSSTLQDTWTWDGTTWTPLPAATGPSPRYGVGFAVLPALGQMVMSGGRDAFPGGSFLGDTWLWTARAAFTRVGDGCAGSGGVPMLSASPGSRPIVGQTLSMQITNLPNVATVVIPWIGLSSQTWGPFSLPRSLAVHGMPGCTQYASVDTTYFLFPFTGSIGWQVPIPPLHALVGQAVHVQALVADPRAGNSLGATVTNAGILQLGGL